MALSIHLCYRMDWIVIWYFIIWSLIFFLLTFFQVFLFCLLFLASSVWPLFFLISPFFLYDWNWSRNWWCPVLGVWNGKTFLFFLLLHRQHCLIQVSFLVFIASCFSCMWLCCLEEEVLVGKAMFLSSFILNA